MKYIPRTPEISTTQIKEDLSKIKEKTEWKLLEGMKNDGR